MTTALPTRRRLAPWTAFLALLVLGLPGVAAAADVELEVVTIEATGKPTGQGPQLDEAIRDLPGIDEWCLMFARCHHVSTTAKKLDWKQDLRLGRGSQQLTVSAQGPGDGEVTVLNVRIGSSEGACLNATELAKPGKPIPRFCKRPSNETTMIYVITARRLSS